MSRRSRAQLYVEMLEAGFTAVGEFHYLHHAPRRRALRRTGRDGRAHRRRGASDRDRLDAAAGVLRPCGLRRRAAAARAAPLHHRSRRLRPPARDCRAAVARRSGAVSASRRTFLRAVDARRTRRGRRARRRRADPHPRRRADQGGRGLPRLVGRAAGRMAARSRRGRRALVPDPRHPHDRERDATRWRAPARSPASARSPRPISATASSTRRSICAAGGGSASARIPMSRSASPTNSSSSNMRSACAIARATSGARRPDRPAARFTSARSRAAHRRCDRRQRRASPGAAADLVTLRADHPALAGRSGDAILDAWIFSVGNPLVDCVWSGGRKSSSTVATRRASRSPRASRRQCGGSRMSAVAAPRVDGGGTLHRRIRADIEARFCRANGRRDRDPVRARADGAIRCSRMTVSKALSSSPAPA